MRASLIQFTSHREQNLAAYRPTLAKCVHIQLAPNVLSNAPLDSMLTGQHEGQNRFSVDV